MFISSSLRAGIPLLVTLQKQLSPQKTDRITQMSDIWVILRENQGEPASDVTAPTFG